MQGPFGMLAFAMHVFGGEHNLFQYENTLHRLSLRSPSVLRNGMAMSRKPDVSFSRIVIIVIIVSFGE